MDSSEIEKLQVAAHIADYQAIMTRTTWFMNQQHLSGVAWIALVSFAVSARSSLDSPVLFAWGLLGLSQVAVLIYCFALYEVYSHVHYIQEEVKPRLSKLIQLSTQNFWVYEAQLKNMGKAYSVKFGDMVPAGLSAIGFLATARIRFVSGWTRWDIAGALLNAALWGIAARSTIRIVRIRVKFETAIDRP